MSLRPIKDNVMIAVTDLPDISKGGIYIPETAKTQHRSVEGVILAVGPDCKDGLKSGDKVYFEEWSGHRVYIDGVDHLFLPEAAVLGTIEDETTGT